MARLVDAQIAAQARLRRAVAQAVEQQWRALPTIRDSTLDRWLAQVLPVVSAGQRASAVLTNAYISRAVGQAPYPIPPEAVIGAAVRGGTDPREVYSRPFVTVWSKLGEGQSWEAATAAGLARATSAAAMDVQLTQRATAAAAQQADPGIYGYRRVADPGACSFCEMVDGAFVKDGDAMPLHNHCGCSVEPIYTTRPAVTPTPQGVGVQQHGELGAVLTDPAHDFTTAAQALA